MSTQHSLDNFIANFNKHGGMFHANKFEVDFSGLNTLGVTRGTEARDLASFIKTVNVPGRQFATTDFTAWRNSIAVPAGYANEDISMEFFMPADLFPRKIFDRWLNKVVDEDTYATQYWNKFTTNLNITCFDRKDQPMYHLTVEQCYPKASNGFSLDTGESSDVTTITVEFAYNSLKLKAAASS